MLSMRIRRMIKPVLPPMVNAMNEFAKEIPFEDLGSGKAPVKPYISKEYFEREKDVIWRNNWILAGRESDVAEENDFMVFELKVLSMSILITRARDGKLRAFHNICSHRGHKLCHKSSGNSGIFVCSFHGWAYELTGELRGVSWEGSFREGVDRNDAALSPITVDTWGGFIFIHVNPEPRQSLKEYLNGFPEPMEAYLREHDWRWFSGNAYMVNHNWKLGVEGNEGYHAETLHKVTLGAPLKEEQLRNTVFDSPGVLARETFLLPEMPVMPGLDAAGMEKMMMEMMAAFSSPVEMLAARYSRLSGFSGKEDMSDVSAGFEGALNVEGNPRWIFDGYYIFPNQFIVLQKDEFHLFTLWPVDVNTSIYHWDSFQLGEPESFGELFGFMQKTVFSGEITAQDIYVAECMQGSFESGAIDSVYVSDAEVPVRAFQKRATEDM